MPRHSEIAKMPLFYYYNNATLSKLQKIPLALISSPSSFAFKRNSSHSFSSYLLASKRDSSHSFLSATDLRQPPQQIQTKPNCSSPSLPIPVFCIISSSHTTHQRSVKKLSAVEAWEGSRKAALEPQLKKFEEKLEKQKAAYAETMKNKISLIHKQAEEKRATLEALRGEEILKAEEMAAKYRATGKPPKKPLLGCF